MSQKVTFLEVEYGEVAKVRGTFQEYPFLSTKLLFKTLLWVFMSCLFWIINILTYFKSRFVQSLILFIPCSLNRQAKSIYYLFFCESLNTAPMIIFTSFSWSGKDRDDTNCWTVWLWNSEFICRVLGDKSVSSHGKMDMLPPLAFGGICYSTCPYNFPSMWSDQLSKWILKGCRCISVVNHLPNMYKH